MTTPETTRLAEQLSPTLRGYDLEGGVDAHLDAPEPGAAPEIADLDLHTTAFLGLVRKAIRAWDPPHPEALPRPTGEGRRARVDLPFGALWLVAEDEDWPAQDFLRVASLRALRSFLFPLADRDARWPSPERARAVLAAELPPGEVLPKLVTPWAEMSSDEATSRLAFAGLGALRLAPVPAGDPDGAAWVSDWAFLSGFDVREGFERYGAVAWFDEAQRPVRIHWCHGHRDVRPGDPEWAHAKWVWRSTLFVGTTVVDHLVGVHWVVSSQVTAAVKENLGVDHPLRRLLAPHTFRTVTINYNSTFSLCPELGFVHRATALTADALQEALDAAVKVWRYTTAPEVMARKDAARLGEDFPFVVDGLALWGVIRAHVDRYVALYYDGDAAARDPQVKAMWAQLDGAVAAVKLPPLTRESLVDLLAQFIWTVTGLHEAAGAVVEYVVDPTFVGTKLRPGAEMSDVQATLQGLLIMGLTGLRQPALLGDFGHLALDEAGRGAFARFRAELTALADEIDRKNLTRRFPYNGFNPRNLESSVSI